MDENDAAARRTGRWVFEVEEERTEAPPPADSHWRAAMKPSVFLEKTDGTQLRQRWSDRIDSYFPDAEPNTSFRFPKPVEPLSNWSLVVTLAAGITTVPVHFEFKDLPLP